tara:strand:+ start:1471 stop:1809 length:339 start_codon:yes stop_codon:yes gene_type:complete
MVRINPHREDCIISIKELIRDDIPRNEIVDQMKQTYPEVHQSTFYDWFKDANDQLQDEDFVSGACIIETERQIKIKLKKRLIADLEKDYDSESDPTMKRNLRNDLLKLLKQF